jgi:branched-chain amino acid aminotransferase
MLLPLRKNHFMERAAQYGDLLFETMFHNGTSIRHIERHYARLTRGLSILKMPEPNLSFAEFKQKIDENLVSWIKQNTTSPAYRIRFTVCRNGSGNYLPQNPILSYHQNIVSFNNQHFKSDLPLKAGLYAEQTKAPGVLANLKSGNALIYVMASIFAKEQGWEEALILNTNGHIIESTTSNIFWQAKQQWFTPPLSDGCIAGIGREVFMENNKVIEKSCNPIDLKNAEQCILTNALWLERKFVPIFAQ